MGLPDNDENSGVWLTFASPISETSLNQVFSSLSPHFTAGTSQIHILFQSIGGGVGDGLALYNFFRSAPVPLVAYNVGNVASVATVAYLGADRRVCSRHGIFMIHRPTNRTVLNLRTASMAADSLRYDENRMVAVLRERTRLPDEVWMHDIDTLFQPEIALKYGIATEIGEWSPPPGSKIFNIVAP